MTTAESISSLPASQFERFLSTLAEPLREECRMQFSGSGIAPNHPVFKLLADFHEKNIPKEPASDFYQEALLHSNNAKQLVAGIIRSYFDRVNHDWLRRMLRERVNDPVILRLIDKWLSAGVLKDGLFAKTEEGVPQGGPISPILANIYLHYALDLWFERVFKRGCRGEAHLVRYADDFVVGLQYEPDARNFMAAVRQRLAKFHLEIAEEKTRRIVFGRYARERMAERQRKPEEFDFLGFRHICGKDRTGKFALIRLPGQKGISNFLKGNKKWLQEHMHWKVRDQQRKLSEKLRGFYGYYALPHCGAKLYAVHGEVMKQWRNVLKRRSQRSKTHWSYLQTQSWFELPTPVSIHGNV